MKTITLNDATASFMNQAIEMFIEMIDDTVFDGLFVNKGETLTLSHDEVIEVKRDIEHSFNQMFAAETLLNQTESKQLVIKTNIEKDTLNSILQMQIDILKDFAFGDLNIHRKQTLTLSYDQVEEIKDTIERNMTLINELKAIQVELNQ